jgi:hypothetical protein
VALSKLARRHIVINVGKFAFCGLVISIAMLGGCVAEEPSDITTGEEALVLSSEDDEVVTVFPEPDAKTEEVAAAADIGIKAVISFHRTCNDARAIARGDGAVTYAEASSCRRRNGTWTGPREWRGVCHGNVANIDGNIRCNP